MDLSVRFATTRTSGSQLDRPQGWPGTWVILLVIPPVTRQVTIMRLRRYLHFKLLLFFAPRFGDQVDCFEARGPP